MKVIITFGAVIMGMYGYSQNLEWSLSMGGDEMDFASNVHVDGESNVIVTGAFSDTVDFDPGLDTFNPIAQEGQDFFLQKLDSDGTLLWVVSYSGGNTDVGNDIITDDQNNIYVTGKINDNISIIKFDPFGNLIWFFPVAGLGLNEGKRLDLDPITGDLIVVAEFQNTIYFSLNGTNTPFEQTPGANPSTKDIVVIRIHANGYPLWVKTYGGISFKRIWGGCHVDESGNIFIIGIFQNDCDFDPSANTFNLTSNGDSDVFIQKLDNSGNHLWTKQIGGNFTETTNGSHLMNGNLYITGSFQSTVDFDPDSTFQNEVSQGGADIFILAIDTSGLFQWVKTFGGSSNDIGASLVSDNLGNIYNHGYFRSTVDFGSGSMTSLGDADLYLLKLDALGNFQNVWHMGGSSYDGPGGLALGESGEIYGVGGFEGNPDFDFQNIGGEHFSEGGFDAFVYKLDEFLNVNSNLEKPHIVIYPNPSRESIDIQCSGVIQGVEILDTRGRVQHRSIHTEINISHLSSGMYFVWIETENGRILKRFIKE